jgi:hypothetical protein
MTPKKKYALKVARKAWSSELPIVVAHIPWDQFEATGGPGAYATLIEPLGSIAVIVSKSPDGKWASSTKIKKEWEAICEETPLDSLEWQTMAIEADHYPWELFGTPS